MEPRSDTYTERLPHPTASEVPAVGRVVGRTLRGLRTFARRNPLSAFWGCVAALIISVAILAPLIAPYDPFDLSQDALSAPTAPRASDR